MGFITNESMNNQQNGGRSISNSVFRDSDDIQEDQLKVLSSIAGSLDELIRKIDTLSSNYSNSNYSSGKVTIGEVLRSVFNRSGLGSSRNSADVIIRVEGDSNSFTSASVMIDSLRNLIKTSNDVGFIDTSKLATEGVSSIKGFTKFASSVLVMTEHINKEIQPKKEALTNFSSSSETIKDIIGTIVSMEVDIVKGMVATTSIIGASALLGYAISNINVPQTLLGLGTSLSILTSTTLLFAGLSKLIDVIGGDLKPSDYLLLSANITILSGATWLMAKLASDIGSMENSKLWIGLGIIAGITSGTIALIAAYDKLVGGGFGLLDGVALSGTIALLSGATWLMAKLANDIGLMTEQGHVWSGLGVISAIIGGVLAISALLTAGVAIVGVGLVVLAGVGLIIGELALVTRGVINVVEYTNERIEKAGGYDKYLERVNAVFGVVRHFVNGFTSVLGGNILSFIGDSIKSASLSSTIGNMLLSVSGVLNVIDRLNSMQVLDRIDSNGNPIYKKLNLNKDNATQYGKTLANVITGFLSGLLTEDSQSLLTYIENSDFDDASEKITNALLGNQKWYTNIGFGNQASRNGGLLLVISNITDLISNYSSMTLPIFDDRGRVVRYEQLNPENMHKGGSMLSSSIVGFLSNFVDILDNRIPDIVDKFDEVAIALIGGTKKGILWGIGGSVTVKGGLIGAAQAMISIIKDLSNPKVAGSEAGLQNLQTSGHLLGKAVTDFLDGFISSIKEVDGDTLDKMSEVVNTLTKKGRSPFDVIRNLIDTVNYAGNMREIDTIDDTNFVHFNKVGLDQFSSKIASIMNGFNTFIAWNYTDKTINGKKVNLDKEGNISKLKVAIKDFDEVFKGGIQNTRMKAIEDLTKKFDRLGDSIRKVSDELKGLNEKNQLKYNKDTGVFGTINDSEETTYYDNKKYVNQVINLSPETLQALNGIFGSQISQVLNALKSGNSKDLVVMLEDIGIKKGRISY